MLSFLRKKDLLIVKHIKIINCHSNEMVQQKSEE